MSPAPTKKSELEKTHGLPWIEWTRPTKRTHAPQNQSAGVVERQWTHLSCAGLYGQRLPFHPCNICAYSECIFSTRWKFYFPNVVVSRKCWWFRCQECEEKLSLHVVVTFQSLSVASSSLWVWVSSYIQLLRDCWTSNRRLFSAVFSILSRFHIVSTLCCQRC